MSELVKLKPGERLGVVERTEKITELKELIEHGYMSLSSICDHFGVALATASEWRKAAMVMIAANDDGYTRDALRYMQTGRIMSKIERCEISLSKADTLDDELKVHDRIIKYYDALARITGLNSETVEVKHSIKPLTINMPTPIEGEVIKEQSNT